MNPNDALNLIFGGDTDMGQTQSPMPRPGPIERPIRGAGSFAMPIAPIKPQRGMSPADASDLIFGNGPAAGQSAPAVASAEPFPGYKDPKKESWAQWADNNVRGRKDPRFEGMGSLERDLESEFKGPTGDDARGSMRQIGAGYPFAATDDQQFDIAKSALGNRFISRERDAYGADVITYRGPDGQPKKSYLNAPGLDSEDLSRGIMQAAPYIVTGGALGTILKGVGSRIIGMGGVAGLTSMGNDMAAQVAGSEQPVDPERALVAAGLGAAGEVAAPLVGMAWRKWVTEPSLFKNGALTPKGEAAAKASGLDPAEITQELAKQFSEEYARTGSMNAGKTVLGKEFGIESSRGQITKDPGQLLTEKGMRYGSYGDAAKDTMQTMDRRQAQQIKDAALGDATAKKSVAATIAPDRSAPANVRPSDIGSDLMSGMQDAQSAAKQGAREAWKGVGPIPPTPEALAELPGILGPKLGNMRVDSKVTPASAAMLEDVRAFMKGELPSDFADVIGKPSIPDVVEMRKRLFGVMRSAKPDNEADKAAARSIYEGYSEWIETSATAALKGGDPVQAAALRMATDRTRDMKAIFAPGGMTGNTPGRRVMQSLLDEGTTPETIVGKLFSTNPGAQPKAGTVEALKLIKAGADKYLPPERAAALWNDVRLGYWMKLVQKSDGSLHTPTMIAQNIDKARQSQSTVFNMLFTLEDKKLIGRFSGSMKEIAYKDPNPSGSGTAVQFYAGQFGQAIIRMVMNPSGPMGRILSGIMNWSGTKNAIGSIAAQRAVTPAVAPTVNPALGTYGPAVLMQTPASEVSPLTGWISPTDRDDRNRNALAR